MNTSDIRSHRGNLAGSPEFTLPGLVATAKSGVSMIEFDGRLTADGVPVVMHDVSIDRTTNGTGNVDALTLAQLKSFYIDEYGLTSLKVPTLVEALAVLIPWRVRVMIEAKVIMAAKLAAAVVESGFPLDRLVLLTGLGGDSPAQFHAVPTLRDVPVWGIFGGTPVTNGGASWISTVKGLGYAGGWFWPAVFTADDAVLCREQGWAFSYLADNASAPQALAWGVSNISTDDPVGCVAAVAAGVWDAYKLGLSPNGQTQNHDGDAFTNLEEMLLGTSPTTAAPALPGQGPVVSYVGSSVNRVAHLAAHAPALMGPPVFAWIPQWSDDGATWSDVPAGNARLHSGGWPLDQTWRWTVDLQSPTRQARLVARPFPLP